VGNILHEFPSSRPETPIVKYVTNPPTIPIHHVATRILPGIFWSNLIIKTSLFGKINEPVETERIILNNNRIVYILDRSYQTWNQLHSWILEASEAIMGLREIKRPSY